jgi:hypothetical protein
LLRVVLSDPERFEFLGKEKVVKSCRVGREAIAIADFICLLGAADLVDPVVGVIAAVSVAGGVAVRVASASAVSTTTDSFVVVVGGTTATVAVTAAATALATVRAPPGKSLGVGLCSPGTRLRLPSDGVRLRLVAS